MLKGSAKAIWEETGRDLAINVLATCKSDPNLERTLEYVIQKVDSDIAEGKDFSERLDNIVAVIGNDNYFHNAHQRTPDAQVKLIRELAEKLQMIHKMATHEARYQVKEVEEKTTKERLPLSSDDLNVESVYGVKPLRERL